MREENRQLKFGALISYLAIFINTFTALIYLPWMARKIGQSNYALYNLAYSFVQIFLSDFGLSASAARFLAKYRAEHQEQKSSVLLSMITRLNAFIDLIFAAILIILYFFLDQVDGIKAKTMGYISSLPKSMANDNTILANAEYPA